MSKQEIIAMARETVAAMSESRGWGADEVGLRTGARDHDPRVQIAVAAIKNALASDG
jgi:hypothetical protein